MTNCEITPLQLAEEIPPEELRKFYDDPRKRSSYKYLSRLAQSSLEMSLSSARLEGRESQNYFDTARDSIKKMTSEELSFSDRSLNALYPEAVILESQLPVLDDRRLNFQGISTDSMELGYVGILRILHARVNRRREGRLKIPLPESRRAELEIAGLLSRMGEATLFPYFAVGREERSNTLSEYNHDFYVITKKGTKVPIQIKTTINDNTKKYDPQVLLFGRNRIGSVVQDVDVAHRGISSLLWREHFGSLSYRERRRLNSMSRYVEERVQEHIETNLQ